VWGAALRFGGPRAGLTYGDYSRQGYTGWILKDIVWSGKSGRFTAQQMELPNPVLLLLRGVDAGPVKIAHWQWVQRKTATETKPAGESDQGWSSTYEEAQGGIGSVIRWLPDLTADDGILQIAGQKISIAHIGWSPAKQQLDFAEAVVAGHRLNGQVAWDPQQAVIRARLVAGDGNVAIVASPHHLGLNGEWWDQPITGSATFAETGWWPIKAELTALNWTVPGSRLKLKPEKIALLRKRKPSFPLIRWPRAFQYSMLSEASKSLQRLNSLPEPVKSLKKALEGCSAL